VAERDVMAEQCTGRGARGVVAAAAPLAASIGVDILRRGGNACDAAVAAALVETVLLPPKCGLGGDLIALHLAPGGEAPEALIAVGGAPRGLADFVMREGLADTGPLSVGPPGAPAGYQALAERGRLGRAELAAGAMDLAEQGFAWATVATRLSEQSAQLVSRWNPGGTSYYPDGVPHQPGAVVRLPGLAKVLSHWVNDGAGLLGGVVGASIVAAVSGRGGVLTQDDLDDAMGAARWSPCAQETIQGRPLWVTPSPTHGPALLAAVADSRPEDGPGDTYRRVMAAVASSRSTLADPSGTSMVSAVDDEGRVVVIVHSNSYPRFGSGIVVTDFDLVLANRAGRGFTAEPGHPNFPLPGRRPATTLHAWMLGDSQGRPVLAGATPGGVNQMPWNAQLLERAIRGDQPGDLVAAPLWEWLPDDNGVRVEAGFTDDELESLRAATPRMIRTGRWGCKSAIQITEVSRAGQARVAAADPRTVGAALGW
jgi:gamma-glutamyltranspeptidase / glutathione hydrolase